MLQLITMQKCETWSLYIMLPVIFIINNLFILSNGFDNSTYASNITNINASLSNTKPDSYYSLNPFMDLAKFLKINPVFLHNNSIANNSNTSVDFKNTPEYLYKLYKSLALNDGEGVGEFPYQADAIYGHLVKESRGLRHFRYSMDGAINITDVVDSDFHLYRLPRKTRLHQLNRSKRSSYFLIIKLYMVTHPSRNNTPYGNLLIDVKKIPINKYGWIVFNSSTAVRKWIEKANIDNYGLYVSVQYSNGYNVSPGTVEFIRNSMLNTKRLQPIVSVYIKETNTLSHSPTTEKSKLVQAFESFQPNRYQQIYNGDFYVAPSSTQTVYQKQNSEVSSRLQRDGITTTSTTAVHRPDSVQQEAILQRDKRSDEMVRKWFLDSNVTCNFKLKNTDHQKSCSLHPMKVDFEKMGWHHWIIAPRGFDAKICAGICPYPLGMSYYPTNHAVVQSIWYHINPENKVIGPSCCVPHKLGSLRLLYYNEGGSVVLMSYQNMIVKSCGCK